MKKICVYCERKFENDMLDNASYELISKAYELKNQAKSLLKNDEEYEVEAVCIADFVEEESVKKAFLAGADIFTLIKNKNNTLNLFSQTVYAQSFIEYFNQNPSEVILFPATPKGRIVAPRITTILQTGLVADCTDIEFIMKDNKLKLAPTRPTFGAELMATILSKTNPQCATIRPKIFKADFTLGKIGKYNEYVVNSYEELKIRLLNSVFDNSDNIADYSDTKVIFIAGFGLAEGKNREYFEKLEKLATITGSKIGATRKTVDYGLMPQKYQIGQTGSNVQADLCLSFGVSGAIQHIMGMKNCKKIVAINSDKNAHLFKYADYKAVTDAKKVIDDLLKILS